VGSTLTASPGTWTAGTVLTYQWLNNGMVIPGAVAPTLRLTSTLGRRGISVRVTGALDGYPTFSTTSVRSAKVMTAAARPRISGAAAVGRTLTAKPGTWMSGVRIHYRWYANGVPIVGADETTFRISSRLATRKITLRTVGTRDGYATVIRFSGATPYVQHVGNAGLSGKSVATRYLTATPGTWVSGTSFTYAWYLNGNKISGATSSRIYVKPSWKGKRLKARVTGRKSGYSTFSDMSASSSAVTLPGRTDPISSWNCPSWAPIKGNASSMIYHMPYQRYYDATKPEDCFSTESAARNAGYRKAKV
jgi:fluoride ion exporter CrcB/FEX